MRKLFLRLSLVFVGNVLLASNTLFEKANKFYAEQRYEDAIAYYDSIQQKGLKSAALCYNLGNAHYKLQSWAQSI